PAATAQTITPQGIVTVTTGVNSFTVGAPAQTIVPQGAVTVTNGVNSFTVNAPAQVTQTITPQGAVTVTTGVNSFTVGAPAAVAQTIVPQGAVTVTNGVNSFTVSAPAQVAQTITPQGAVTVTAGVNSFTIGASSAVPQTITPQGIVTVTTGANSFTVGAPAQTIVPQGAVTVTNGINSFTVNAPAQVTQTITPQGAVTVTTGVNSFTVGAPAAVAQTIVPQGAVTVTNGVNSFTVSAPAQVAQTITPQGAVTVTAGVNSFTIGASSAVPQTITPQGIVTVTTGANSFTVGAPAQTIVPQGAVTVTNGINSFTVNAPAQVTQTITPQGAVTVTTGVNSFTVGAPAAVAQTIVPQGAVTVTNGANSFTVSAPAQIAQTITPQGALTVTNGVNSFTISGPAATPTTVILGTGAVVVTSVAPNNFTVDVPITTVTQGTNIAVSGSYPNFTVSALPTLALNSGSLLSISGGNTVTIPATNISLTTGTAAAASISTVGLNNFSLNIPSAITPTITPSGVLSRTATGSSFTLDVPAPVYVAATGALNTGTASVNITPLATFVGTVLTVGPTTNTVGIPFTQTTSIIGTGAALVTSNTAANYTVDVPQTSLTQSTNISINGSFPSYTISALPTLALASGSVLSISGGNSVVFPGLTTMAAAGVATVSAGPNYTVGVPASNIAMTFSAGAAGVSTTSANNFNLNIPSPNIAVTQTAGAAGITTVSANSYNINIPAPTYVAATGALNSGTASVNITQALSISGNTITSGPASNSISLSLITNTLWSTVGNAGTSPATNFIGTTDAQDLVVKTSGTEQMRVTTAGKVGIGSNAPSENLQVETGGNTAVSILGSSSSVANIGFGLTGGNHTMGNIRYNNSNNSFNLWTNNTANRLVIDNAGLVGIGLATPTYPLHVNGDVKANYLHGDVINDAGTLQSLRLRGNGSVLFVADDNNDDVSSGFTWYNNGEAALNIQMLLDNSGNLGIGNALPTQRVDITGNLKFSGALMPNNLPGTSGYILTSAGAGVAPTWQNPNGLSWGLLGNSLTSTVTNFVGTTDNVGLAFRTNNAIRMSILNTGNVTVGTPSNPEPDGLLNVVSNNAAVNGLNGVFLDIQNSSNTTNNLTGIRFTGSSAANWYTKTAILVPYTNGSFGVSDMIFALNNVNAIGAVSTADAKMIIKSNGNVGIGTTAPNFYSGTGRYLSVSASTVYSANQTAALELEGSSISGVVPTAKLDFNSVGPPNTPTVTGRLSLYPSAANGIYGGDLAFSTYNGSTLGERMRISDNGKIGINTSAPDATLSIEGSFDAGTGNTVTNALSFAMGVSNNVTGVGSGAIGSFNTVAGNRAFGFGNFVSVPNLGSVAFGDWSGGSPTTLASSTSDEFSARFSNGYRFFTDPALTPSLGVYISSAGKVGIGTATPADRFSVYGSKFSVSDGPHLSFTTDEDIYPVSYMLNWGHNEQWLMFNGYYDGSFRSSSTVGNYAITNQTSGSQALIFKTNQGTAPGSSIGTWTNALAISGAGFVGIGLVAPLYQLHVEKNNAGTVAFFDNNSTAGGTCLLAQVNTNSLSAGTRMAIDAQTRFGNGTGYGINATSWYNSATNYGVYGYGYGGTGAYGVQGQAGGTAGTCYGILGSAFGSGTNYAVYASGNLAYTGALQSISDQRFKDDIQPLTGALDKLMKLQPKTYNMKVAEYDYMNFSKTRQFGLIAQEVEEVLPELVEKGVNPGPVDAKTREPLGEEITFKTMNYLGLTPVIIQAIKEQQQQIEDLKKVVAEQQKQIDQLLKK
ncbi:MAG: tail fiber domain-containing protein, partial [bacterium]|nr:tail fiber domain-containing protein [bacterium]